MNDPSSMMPVQIGFSNANPFEFHCNTYAIKQSPDGIELWLASCFEEMPQVRVDAVIITLPGWALVNNFSATKDLLGFEATCRVHASENAPSPRMAVEELGGRVGRTDSELANILFFELGDWGGVARFGRVVVPRKPATEGEAVINLISSLHMAVWLAPRVLGHLYLDLAAEARLFLGRVSGEFPNLQPQLELVRAKKGGDE